MWPQKMPVPLSPTGEVDAISAKVLLFSHPSLTDRCVTKPHNQEAVFVSPTPSSDSCASAELGQRLVFN